MRMYPEWIHHELLNWSRWCWQGPYPHPLPPSHCASYEANYIRTNEENTSDGARPIPPNADRAKVVDAVWQSLPDREKRVLRTEYPQRHEWISSKAGYRAAAKFAGVRFREYQPALVAAVNRVMDAFGGED